MSITVQEMGAFVDALKRARDAIKYGYLSDDTATALVEAWSKATTGGLVTPGEESEGASAACAARGHVVRAGDYVAGLDVDAVRRNLRYVLGDLDEVIARDIVRRVVEAEGETPAPSDVEPAPAAETEAAQ